jgi:4-diphosphocytidyl-2-C-methyl-D-erythritol kinase
MFTIRAFAKINLSLRVVASRTDGFHDIQTIFQSIDLFDRVKCQTTRGPFSIHCSTVGVPTDRTNLVWKAAQRLWSAAGRHGEPRDVLVTLEKNIPMQAGLGGGSSDAAAGLLALRRVWKLRVTDEELYQIASAVGSDVPYFLIGGTALGLGRGEEIYPLAQLPRLWVVLLLLPFGVPTKDAYAWWDEKRGREGIFHEPGKKLFRPLFWPGTSPLVNDLEAAVIDRHPMIGVLKERLENEGALIAAMSGSGSAVFGVFMSGSAARLAAKRLKHAGAEIRLARFQDRRRP